MNNQPTKRLYGSIDTIKKPEQKAIVPLNMVEGNQIIRPKLGCVLSEVVVEKPDTLSPENIVKGINIGGVVGSYAGPPLFPPIISGGTNLISWSNNPNNGAFGSLSATLDGVTVTSPLTVTQDMDGATLTVTVSETEFQSSSATITVVYISPDAHVVAVGTVPNGESFYIISGANMFFRRDNGENTRYLFKWDNVPGTQSYSATVSVGAKNGNSLNMNCYGCDETEQREFMPLSVPSSNPNKKRKIIGTVKIENKTRGLTRTWTFNGDSYISDTQYSFEQWAVGDELKIIVNIN